MKLTRILLAPWIVGLVAVSATAADRTKVDRTLRKEPAYRSKSPKYALLLLGPDAKRRVWIVLDGDVLYVDRNGNGDLTDDGGPQKLAGQAMFQQVPPGPGNSGGCTPYPIFALGALPDAGGRLLFSDLTFNLRPSEEEGGVAFGISTSDPKALGKQTPRPGMAVAVSVQIASGVMADRPADAPVIHLGGPLAMSLSRPKDAVLVRGPKGTDLYVMVGTIVTANGSRVLTLAELPAGAHPVAEIEFPSKRGTAPIRVNYVLKERC